MMVLYNFAFAGTNYPNARAAAVALIEWLDYSESDDAQDWSIYKIAGRWKVRRADGMFLHDDGVTGAAE